MVFNLILLFRFNSIIYIFFFFQCDENINVLSGNCSSFVDSAITAKYVAMEKCSCAGEMNKSPKQSCHSNSSDSGGTMRTDCGYSSGLDVCDSCSVPSSNDGSDIACSEGTCNHDGESSNCSVFLKARLYEIHIFHIGSLFILINNNEVPTEL